VAKQNIKQMMEEALGEGQPTAAKGPAPVSTGATAVAPIKPASAPKPPRPQVVPPLLPDRWAQRSRRWRAL